MEELEIVKSFTQERINKDLIKWKNLGFLDGLSENQKTNVTIAYEIAAFVIMKDVTNRFDNLATISFPVLLRIFKKKEISLGVEFIICTTLDILENLNNELNKYNRPLNIERLNDEFISSNDHETLFVAKFCENYII